MKKETILLSTFFAVLLFLAQASASQNDTNQVLINEFTVDPQYDWDESGGVSSNDEWFEIYNPSLEEINVDGWTFVLIDSGSIEVSLEGIIPSEGYGVIQNPIGQQDNSGRLELYDSEGVLVDSISYGDFNDGNSSDNAQDGNADSISNECLARFPNGVDSSLDNADFIKTSCTYGLSNELQTIPVEITTLPPQPSCILDTNEVILSANISGSISSVKLIFSLGGEENEIALDGTAEGVYSYTIDSSNFSGSEDLIWQFVVEDLLGSVVSSEPESTAIHSSTHLEISPELPDGQNGWYVSEPLFDLFNSDASDIFYRWNGEQHQYEGIQFGLEGTPNGGNVTGGTLVLNYNSNVCNETEKSFIGKFDFTDPEIRNLVPTPGAEVLNEQQFVISAYIDETYQGNSGINFSSVILTIDEEQVPISVESAGILDASLLFTGNISDGEHEVTVYAEDYAGHASSESWTFTVTTVVDFNMTIYSPAESVYSDRRVPFNITFSREALELSFVNADDSNPVQKLLCKNCVSFGFEQPRLKSLREGENHLTFFAEDLMGLVIQQSLLVTVDSENPRIRDTSPHGGLASGTFSVTFDEENPSALEIIYGNDERGFFSHQVNLSLCEKNDLYICTAEIDLYDFDGMQIQYRAHLTDIAGNTDESSIRKLDVDLTPPQINSFDFETSGKYATLTLQVDEAYLDEVVYIDNIAQKEKRLCNYLIDGICSKKISLQEGVHNLTVVVRDMAGNEAEADAFFFTDSKYPKIKQTLPKKDFATGEFSVLFEEINPSELSLLVGNLSDSLSSEVNLSDCTPEKKNIRCTVYSNLSQFEGQHVTYQFNLTDMVGNYVLSKPIALDVDTTAPQIELFNYSLSGRNVDFVFEVSDVNMDEITYIDQTENNPRLKTLCSRFTYGKCEISKRFSVGEHALDIFAIDKAGNSAIVVENLLLSVNN